MTGFGKATGTFANRKITIEVKSLNSKNLDLNVRTPSYYREKEMSVRSLAAGVLKRGKAEVSIYIENIGAESEHNINIELAKNYHTKLKALAESINDSPAEYLSTLVKMPEVIYSTKEEIDEEEWACTKKLVQEALQKLDEFRLSEGNSIKQDLESRAANILDLLGKTEPMEQERVDGIKNRIKGNLEEAVGKENTDNNRFEQELIYYMEKLDVSEEKSRLRNHCQYFTEVLNSDESEGKKLGFISQEMGREINTLGAKANHAGMQQLVVQMKDELEKIKEQVLNAL